MVQLFKLIIMLRRNKQKNQSLIQNQGLPFISSTYTRLPNYQQLFEQKSLPKFNLQSLKEANPKLLSNQKFLTLLSELQHWNHSLENTSKPICNRRSQLKRNQQIHSSLMRIVLQPKNIYPAQLQKLFEWYMQSSQKADNNFGIHASLLENCKFFKKRKLTEEDEENQIRNTYKTSLPYQLHQYRRRKFEDVENKRPISKSNNKQNKNHKLLFEDRSHYKQVLKLMENHDRMLFYNEQKRLRLRRQMQEIQSIKIQWNFQRGKFQEQTAKNFYNGKFRNTIIKSIEKKSNVNTQSAYTTFTNSFTSPVPNQTSYLSKKEHSTNLSSYDDTLSSSYNAFLKGPECILGITLMSNNVDNKKKKIGIDN